MGGTIVPILTRRVSDILGSTGAGQFTWVNLKNLMLEEKEAETKRVHTVRFHSQEILEHGEGSCGDRTSPLGGKKFGLGRGGGAQPSATCNRNILVYMFVKTCKSVT